MKVFAVSDIHVDYDTNRQWIANLSVHDYRDDVLILAGDVSDSLQLLEWCLRTLASRFRKVLYVPGNHDLWVIRDAPGNTSLEKFQQVRRVAGNCDVSMQTFQRDGLSVVPLFGWYDYSFGEPTDELLGMWMDYHACRWPPDFGVSDVTSLFLRLNEAALGVSNDRVISFSHFLPRIDLMPGYVPGRSRVLYPILGSALLDQQVRQIKPEIHVYGHSHVNRRVSIDGISYINNAFGYPQETAIAAKRLMCIYED